MQGNSTDLFGNLPLKTCTLCKKAKPISEFGTSRRKENARSYRQSWCKPCCAEKHKARRSTPEGKRAIISSEKKKMYGITQDHYDAMYAQQKGLCAICHKPEKTPTNDGTSIRMLAVEHCHRTGAVRGLACRSCNSGLAQFRDDPDLLRSAIRYLERSTVTPYTL
jgi:hypothetical protein